MVKILTLDYIREHLSHVTRILPIETLFKDVSLLTLIHEHEDEVRAIVNSLYQSDTNAKSDAQSITQPILTFEEINGFTDPPASGLPALPLDYQMLFCILHAKYVEGEHYIPLCYCSPRAFKEALALLQDAHNVYGILQPKAEFPDTSLIPTAQNEERRDTLWKTESGI